MERNDTPVRIVVGMRYAMELDSSHPNIGRGVHSNLGICLKVGEGSIQQDLMHVLQWNHANQASQIERKIIDVPLFNALDQFYQRGQDESSLRMHPHPRPARCQS